jgi:SpoVK/Ycf46/Vps4 family AAA+-type ATPase
MKMRGQELDKIAKRKNRMETFCLEGIAQHIKSDATWEDLGSRNTFITCLRGICNQIKGSRRRRKGLRMLITGPSGTGKIMAAVALANELELNLYSIDLSQVINKYIGETEKKLEEVLDAAEDGDTILFFDEAEELFGKRSEAKDSHDRFSNIEVSYLLQQLEQFKGFAILTTNRNSNILKAFTRISHYVLKFS